MDLDSHIWTSGLDFRLQMGTFPPDLDFRTWIPQIGFGVMGVESRAWHNLDLDYRV